MANKQVWKGILCAVDGRRLSRYANSITFPSTRATQDSSGLEDCVDQMVKGTFAYEVSFAGNSASAIDEDFLNRLSGADATLNLSATSDQTGAVGGPAVMMRVRHTEWTPGGGARGEMASFNATFQGSDHLALAKILHNNSKDSAGLVVTANGAGVNLGALGAGQREVVMIHYLDPPGVSGSGWTITPTLESDGDNTFATPVIRHTFDVAVPGSPAGGQVQAPGSSFAEIDGDTAPISDTWQRLVFTVAGTIPAAGVRILVVSSIHTKL